MICPNCNNEIPDGSLFCIRCGTKLENTANTDVQVPQDTAAEIPQADVKADAKKEAKEAKRNAKEAKAAAKNAKINAKNAKKEAKYAKATAKEAQRIAKGKKKRHPVLAFFLVLIILILLAVCALAAVWFFVLPQSSRDFVFLQKDLLFKNYEYVTGYFDFTDEDIANDKAGFTEYIRNNFVAGTTVSDVWDQNYAVRATEGDDFKLSYLDGTGKFDGDIFTYGFDIMEPVLTAKDDDASAVDGHFIKKRISGLLTDEYSYECDVTLGNEDSDSNMLTVVLELKDGEISKIKSADIDNDLFDGGDFVEVKNNTLYINKLVVDEAYATGICEGFADFTEDLIKLSLAGKTYKEMADKYEGKFVTELYEDDYNYYHDDRDFYNTYDYELKLEFDHLNELPLYDVNEESLILSAFFKGTIKTLLYEDIIDQNSYLLIRPYVSKECVVMNSSEESDMITLGKKLDEGFSYAEAMEAVYSEIYGDDTVEDAAAVAYDTSDNSASEAAQGLDNDAKQAYFDALLDFEARNDHMSTPKFTLVDIGSDYPLLVCTDGDYHVSTSYLFQYDGKKMVDLGAFGEYGELDIYTKEGVIMTFGGNMGYYMLDYYFIYNGQVDHEVELVIDDSGSKTKYSSKGETITEAEYNDIVEEYEEAYPEDEMMHISYDDAYEINDENIKSILYGRTS